jgi:glycosyltransferase involved in cell wall biosynthesis
MINYEFPPIGGGGGNVTHYISKNLAQGGHDVCVITSRFRDLPGYERKRFQIPPNPPLQRGEAECPLQRGELEDPLRRGELEGSLQRGELGGPFSKDGTCGFEVHRVPVLRKSPNVCSVHEMFTFVVSASLYSLWLVKRFRPHIVHIFFGIPSGPVAYLLKKVYNLPYVVFLGGRDVPRPRSDPPFYRLMYGILAPAIRSIWGNAKAVVACSNGLRELALRWLNGSFALPVETQAKACYSSIKINVIPDGVDLSKFRPVEKDANPDATVKILTIGRLIPRKGFDYLIRSLPEVIKTARKDFYVEIVGDGPLRDELTCLTEQLHVADKVIFAGTVPYEQLAEKYQQADAFVLSSLAEGMPLVVLEAMASGLPIIASGVQGIEDLVEEGVNGHLFPPADHKSLGQYLAAVINDDAIRLQMGKESAKIVRKYDWANIAEQYLRIYGS